MLKFFKTLALSCVLSLTAISAHAETALKPIGENVYDFFSGWYNSLVVVGDNGVLVVDPAWSARAEEMKAAIAKVTDKPITHVVLSHEHYDHAGGTEVFENAEIVCQVTCETIFDLDIIGAAPKKVTTTFEDDLSINLGNKIVELKHIAAGDGVATTVVYVPADQVVATADLYLPGGLTNQKYLDDKNFLGTRLILNEISQWPLKVSLSGHSDNRDPESLKASAAYYNDLYSVVKTELDALIAKGGIGAAFDALLGDLPNQIKLPKYENWKGYNEHLSAHVFRMGMSIAHGG
ncbi:MBL fold metallo-hydrolase [Curvivirga sp.]|uniref:MBL fold metallo-hydrolase n=1 Tax=Curvivirga sp. TaxID=2856848 RepID=UPI003B5C8103